MTAFADKIIVRHAFGSVDDADIARDAALALRKTTLVPAYAVRATVHAHTVTLAGAVGGQHQRAAAAAAVSVLLGVADVRSLIQLKPREAMVPTAMATRLVTPVPVSPASRGARARLRSRRHSR